MRRAAFAFLVLPLLIWVGAIAAGIAAPGFLAVVLACPAAVEGSACSRETATDMLVQPAGEVDCLKVGAVLATHLSLAPGERHKVMCERRRG